MAVGAYALTTLADLKAMLGLTDSDTARDAFLEQCIDRGTALVESVLGWNVVSRGYREWYDLDGTGAIFLRQRNVTSVQTVAYTRMPAMTISCTEPTYLQATASVDEDTITLYLTLSDGSMTPITNDLADYPAMADMASTLDGRSGVNCTSLLDARTYQLVPDVSVDFLSSSQTLYAVISQGSVFRLNRKRGIVTVGRPWDGGWDDDEDADVRRTGRGSAEGFQRCLVEYTAGYATVPDDIIQACLDAAKYLFLNRATDGSLSSESIGGYSYSRASEGAVRKMLAMTLAGRVGIR